MWTLCQQVFRCMVWRYSDFEAWTWTGANYYVRDLSRLVTRQRDWRVVNFYGLATRFRRQKLCKMRYFRWLTQNTSLCAMSSHVAANSTPQISRDVVRFVFRSVWEEFYDWEATHCQSAIRSLGLSLYAPLNSDVITLPRTHSRNRQRTNTILPAPPQFPANDQPNISCLDYTQEDSPVAVRSVVEVINVPKLSAPPVYESVTPATRSIHHGDDDDSMAFVPYADEPTFDALDHTLQYGSFSWQDKFCDPDSEPAGKTDSVWWNWSFLSSRIDCDGDCSPPGISAPSLVFWYRRDRTSTPHTPPKAW